MKKIIAVCIFFILALGFLGHKAFMIRKYIMLLENISSSLVVARGKASAAKITELKKTYPKLFKDIAQDGTESLADYIYAMLNEAKRLYPNKSETLLAEMYVTASYDNFNKEKIIEVTTELINRIEKKPAAKINPDFYSVYPARADAYAFMDNNEAGLRDMEAYALLDDESSLYSRAITYCALGDYDRSEMYLKKYKEKNKKQSSGFPLEAIYAFKHGNYPEALDELEMYEASFSSASRDGSYPIFLYTDGVRVRILAQEKKYKEALKLADDLAAKVEESYAKVPDLFTDSLMFCGKEETLRSFVVFKTRAEIKQALGDEKGAILDMDKYNTYQQEIYQARLKASPLYKGEE
ncbi:hypothetical protein Dip510_001387 [Elusimicrobium posterum]|uniref:hypothetical protein n=1 Tax=Elusimicrobium posterum TaxID=3116653 RepID=UPI003C73B488